MFPSLKEQSLFYGKIADDDSIDNHDKEVGQENPQELAAAIKGLITSPERADMSRDGVQNVKPLVIKLRDGAEPFRMSARKYAPSQPGIIRHKLRELKKLNLV
jgi:hypothetical protein